MGEREADCQSNPQQAESEDSFSMTQDASAIMEGPRVDTLSNNDRINQTEVSNFGPIEFRNENTVINNGNYDPTALPPPSSSKKLQEKMEKRCKELERFQVHMGLDGYYETYNPVLDYYKSLHPKNSDKPKGHSGAGNGLYGHYSDGNSFLVNGIGTNASMFNPSNQQFHQGSLRPQSMKHNNHPETSP